jgi:XTP/dITP diphosphohydrolase
VKQSDKIKLVFVTQNIHKFVEIQKILDDKIDLIKLIDLGFAEDIPEDQDTLEGNAAQKAYFIYNKYGISCFADDTGLEIEALHGEPGVYSARYAGKNCTFDDNINKVLSLMKNKYNRNARFRTIIALVESGKLITFVGEIKGEITFERKGQTGFGYDPIFKPVGYDKTFAEMPISQKNNISHRAIAINKLLRYFSSHL